MTRQGKKATVSSKLSDRDVAEFLRSHPDFFERHPKVLLDMELHHRPGRAAVSLVQRQMEMLRKRNGEMHAQLKEIVAVARDNQELVEKIHRLAVSLLAEVDVERRARMLKARLRDDFQARNSVVLLFSAPFAVTGQDRFLKIVDRRDPRLKSFAGVLKSDEPLCVRLRPAQRRFVFDDADADLNSAALIPLGGHAKHGLMVIGSPDPDHFHPGKSTDYLMRLGDVVSTALCASRLARDVRNGPKASGT